MLAMHCTTTLVREHSAVSLMMPSYPEGRALEARYELSLKLCLGKLLTILAMKTLHSVLKINQPLSASCVNYT